MGQEFSVVGKRLPRPDAIERATGAAKFTTDIRLPGMLIGKVLRSPYPHAKILKIDTSKAEKLAGVEAVITFEDVPKKLFNQRMIELNVAPEARQMHKDQYVLSDKARFTGDAIAAVAATNEIIAEEALKLLDVEYEELPAVFDPIEAMNSDVPRIHDSAGRNIADHVFASPQGDVEKGFQEADYIIEETFVTSKQKHCQLEPTACIASFGAGSRLTIYSPCQEVHPARSKIADIFDMPEGMVRWITPYVGGSFGLRLGLTNEPICIALARKAGRPVKLEDSRQEDFVVRESRQPFIQTGRIGVKKDGTITALQTRLIADAGAYFSQSGATTGLNMTMFTGGLYRCSNTSGEADIVYTNTPISGGLRGFGIPSAMFVLEQIIDMAAEKIGMDPVEFRLRNIKRTGEPSFDPSFPIDSSALDECINLGAGRIGWMEKRQRRKEGTIRQGVGIACVPHCSGAHPRLLEHSNAFIKLNADGSANLIVSPCEMGQGILGALAQIAAEELGVDAQDIHIVTGDTDVTQFDIGSHASRSTYVIGNAVLRAAQEAKEQLLERAAKALGVSVEELGSKDRRVYVKAAPEKGMSIAELCRDAIYNYGGKCLNISGKCSFLPGQSSPFQAAFAEVDVDTETGQVKLLQLVVANDSGRAINPMTVEGQLEGGAVQGIGYALIEDFAIDMNTGATITDSFVTYKIPTVLDLPEIQVIIVEKPAPSGPFGAKGLGELAINAIAPAIANAIYDAVGVRIKELPITPEKIRSALEEKSKS